MCQKFDEYDPRSAAAVYKLSQTSAQPEQLQWEDAAQSVETAAKESGVWDMQKNMS